MEQELEDSAAYAPGRRCVCTHQLAAVRIYLKNNPAKFHLDPIWNDGASCCYLKRSPQQKQRRQDPSSRSKNCR